MSPSLRSKEYIFIHNSSVLNQFHSRIFLFRNPASCRIYIYLYSYFLWLVKRTFIGRLVNNTIKLNGRKESVREYFVSLTQLQHFVAHSIYTTCSYMLCRYLMSNAAAINGQCTFWLATCCSIGQLRRLCTA